ncbi:MAG TPA: VWA domain-containing protein, partial [Xanthomonadales bacterium]|nr:VWA domain-containing protein [Xanthomonadales bacterium]
LWATVRVDPKGKALESQRSPLAVVLVLDASGSMGGDPIAHVIKSSEIVGELLGERDRLAVVTFADHAGVRCGLTAMDNVGRDRLRLAVRDIDASGSTNMHGGIEAAAALLLTAPQGLRRVMVVLSDGQPNVGLSSASDLAAYVRGLGVAVSTLGFGLHHDENVLDAIATAGSGRYAYIPDPVIARVELARAALAHGGVVADQLTLQIKLGEGVSLVQLLPHSPLRHGRDGVTTSLGDVFVDEGRIVAFELELDKPKGRLAEVIVEGRTPDGATHRESAWLEVDINTGAPIFDRDALADIVIVQADGARADARAQADRGAFPAAATILRQLVARIDALDGFVANDGSVLAELREQLVDEAANYEKKSSNAERLHQRKAAIAYKSATPYATPRGARVPAAREAQLVGLAGPVAGHVHVLMQDNTIGRGASTDIPVQDGSLSRIHARVLFVDNKYVLQDMGSTNGSEVNGIKVSSHELANGDIVKLGIAVFRFQQ